MHTPATHTPEQQSPWAVQPMPALAQQEPSARQTPADRSQQLRKSAPAQQVVPAPQQSEALVPFNVLLQTWASGQHVPWLQNPEQQSPWAVQAMPALAQQEPSARQVPTDRSQQLRKSAPTQQVVPASQQSEALVPLGDVLLQTWASGQHVPWLQNPEQQSLWAVQLLPPVVQQEPAVQVCPARHALPQAPQLPASVAVFVHTPLHLV